MPQTDPYKHRLRVRSGGVLRTLNGVLLVNLRSPVSDSHIWTAPGGGVKTGESLKAAAEREFAEETGLTVKADDLLLINELIEEPYHAIEFFFRMSLIKGDIKKGSDPERHPEDQIIKNVSFVSEDELAELDIQPLSLKKMLLQPAESGSHVIQALVQ